MLQRATRDEQADLLAYLSEDIENCLYLYLDIYHYGIDTGKLTVWYEPKEGGYALIAMRYFDALQIYSRDNDFSRTDIIGLIDSTGVNRVHGPKNCIMRLSPALGSRFDAKYGKIIEKVKARDFGELFDRVQEATVEDLPEVVSLILSDKNRARIYSYDELLASLTDLVETGMGRCFLLREDGRVVATETISAQSDLFLITAYLISDQDFRHTLYGTVVESYVYAHAKGDKRMFTFVADSRRQRMLTAQGHPVVTAYGKLILKK